MSTINSWKVAMDDFHGCGDWLFARSFCAPADASLAETQDD